MTKEQFPHRHWSERDILFIRMNYGEMNSAELAEHFNTSKGNIHNILNKNHIKRDCTVPKNWKRWQIELLEAEYGTVEDLNELSQRMGKSVSAMQTMAQIYGISRRKKK